MQALSVTAPARSPENVKLEIVARRVPVKFTSQTSNPTKACGPTDRRVGKSSCRTPEPGCSNANPSNARASTISSGFPVSNTADADGTDMPANTRYRRIARLLFRRSTVRGRSPSANPSPTSTKPNPRKLRSTVAFATRTPEKQLGPSWRNGVPASRMCATDGIANPSTKRVGSTWSNGFALRSKTLKITVSSNIRGDSDASLVQFESLNEPRSMRTPASARSRTVVRLYRPRKSTSPDETLRPRNACPASSFSGLYRTSMLPTTLLANASGAIADIPADIRDSLPDT